MTTWERDPELDGNPDAFFDTLDYEIVLEEALGKLRGISSDRRKAYYGCHRDPSLQCPYRDPRNADGICEAFQCYVTQNFPCDYPYVCQRKSPWEKCWEPDGRIVWKKRESEMQENPLGDFLRNLRNRYAGDLSELRRRSEEEMPCQKQIQEEIAESGLKIASDSQQNKAPILGNRLAFEQNSVVRRKYLGKLSEKTGRNVIAYYSSLLPGREFEKYDCMNDSDMDGFMDAVAGLDRSRGLDLLVQTHGGLVSATESIVHYLHSAFGKDIRIFVPVLALSCGTLLACAAKEIFMGRHSSLGPIDPQRNGFAAQGLLEAFEEASRERDRNPGAFALWSKMFERVDPAFLIECRHDVRHSRDLAREYLTEYMFHDLAPEEAAERAGKIVSCLDSHAVTKIHTRHISYEDAASLGLRVTRLEQDNELQDLVLSVHHCYQELFKGNLVRKIIENQNGGGMVC